MVIDTNYVDVSQNTSVLRNSSLFLNGLLKITNNSWSSSINLDLLFTLLEDHICIYILDYVQITKFWEINNINWSTWVHECQNCPWIF